ncbi:MAG: helix-turn-helix transcriptional regulator [Elusimicrobia bacterium]|nr:helix-turn-helix transcriptional regulator [Elusimicrobiota bacterium]
MNNNNFVIKLLTVLKEKNLTQKELSKNLDIKEPIISRWMKGKSKPSTKSINKLANYFNVPVSYFYNNENIDSNEKDLINQLKGKEREIDILRKEIALRDREIEFLKTQISK